LNEKSTVCSGFVFSGISLMLAESVQELYRDADFVAHIRVKTPPTATGFIHDLGTTWYEVTFEALEVHKNRDTIQSATFRFVHYGYENPDAALFMASTEWIVCLSRTGTQEALSPYTKPEPWMGAVETPAQYTSASIPAGMIWKSGF